MSLAAINKVKALKKEKRRRKNKKKQVIDFSAYRDRPIDFFYEVLGVRFLTEEQKRIALHVVDCKTTNVQAAHGVGKTKICSLITLYYAFCVHGIVISTAPTFNQVNDILWKEIRGTYDLNKKKLGGRRNQLSIVVQDKDGREIKSFGQSTKSNSSDSFQGKHDEYLMMIQDEADGISDVIDEAFEACLTGSENRGIRIGNPLNPNSAFAKNCAISSIKIPVWTHPNVFWAYQVVVAEDNRTIHRLKPEIAERILKPLHDRKDDPVKPQHEWDEDLPRDIIPGAVSVAWIEKVRVKYGEFSNYWQTRVEAEFPTDSVDGIIPLSWLHEARKRYDSDPDYWDKRVSKDRWRIGVDVGESSDRHAVSLWRGSVLYKVKTYATSSDREEIIRVARDIVEPLVNSLGSNCAIAVDKVGVGGGTLGILQRDGYYAIGCTYGESAENKERFKNRKIELHWQFREGLRSGEIAIAPLGEIEAEVFEDLSSIRYETNTDKQICCESKDKTRKRIKRSPDAGDAVIIAGENSYRIPVVATEEVAQLDSEERAISRAIAHQKSYDEVSLDDVTEYFNA